MLGLWHQSRHGVDYHYIHSAAAAEGLGYFKGLFTGIRLGYIQLVNVNSKIFRIYGIQCVLRVDKRSGAAQLLCLCYGVKGYCGLT